MIEQNPRPARKVGIADHLWETFEDMAQQMGSDRDALINQALFMFARLNGFLEVERGPRVESAPVATPSARASTSAPAAGGTPRPAFPPVLAPPPAVKAAAPAPREDTPQTPSTRQPPRPVMEERQPANALDDDPVRREVAERVLETAAELERLIKGKNESQPPPEEVDELPEEEPLPEAEDPNEGMDMLPPEEEPPADEPMDHEEEPAHEEGLALYMVTEAGDQEQIVKDRFIIGRGKHCDFVINSGKVSREHAVITRDGADWFIEDLGSSNGTWFNKQRIKRRKVENGDEYFICSEKVKLVLQ